MKLRRFAATAVCLFASCPVWADMRQTPQIAVYYDFEHAPPAATVAAMQEEVGRIMQPAGLAFIWRDLSERTPQEVFSDLVVIRFHGSCNAEASAPGPAVHSGASLGDTTIMDGHILPFSGIACDELRAYIAPITRGLSDHPCPDHDDGAAAQTVMGRALGRVVAHEMYHIFAETAKHGSGGVARKYHLREELVASEFTFDPREIKLLRDYARRAANGN